LYQLLVCYKMEVPAKMRSHRAVSPGPYTSASSSASVGSCTDTCSEHSTDSTSDPQSIADKVLERAFSSTNHKLPTVAVVDPYTSGATLAAYIEKAGYAVAKVISDPSSDRARSEQSLDWLSPLTIPHATDPSGKDEMALNHTVAQLRAVGDIRAVLAGAEEGVQLADHLAKALSLPGNPLELSSARRNKFDQNEAVRNAGLRAVHQRHVTGVDESLEFFRYLGGRAMILKPLASMKSEDVYLCKTESEVEKAFRLIAGKTNFLNLVNNGALAQEFLDGQEYVVDATSVGGVHKVACVFEIDRQPHLGQFNVMFGARLMDANSELAAKQAVGYALEVLDALGIVNGASHMELRITREGPCLIEVGARPCGDPISPLLDVCLGQNHVQQTVDALLHKPYFDAYPDLPPAPKIGGRQSFIVSHHSGTIEEVTGYKTLAKLPSLRQLKLFKNPGEQLEKTVDQKSQAGFALLWHPDPAILERDYRLIRELERTPGAIFALKPERSG